MLDYVTAV